MWPPALHHPNPVYHICSFLSVHHSFACVSSELRSIVKQLPQDQICSDVRIQASQSISCFEWFQNNGRDVPNVSAVPLPHHLANYPCVEVFDASIRLCARQAKPLISADSVAFAIGQTGNMSTFYTMLQQSSCIPDRTAFCQSTAMGAASCGHLQVIEQFHGLRFVEQSLFLDSLGPDVMNSAAAHGQIDCVRWLHEAGYTCTFRAMDDAAINGHLAIVQWLHENRSEGCSTDAMDYAAMNGHMHILQWLHENRFEGCTPVALNRAAGAGHFEVVQWLHANRSEGCADLALPRAAEGGYLQIVEWLYTHMSHLERDSWAMTYAASNGHLHVVEWLYRHGWHPFTDVAMDIAVECGQLDVVRWLHRTCHEECHARHVVYAMENGHHDVVEWVQSKVIHVQ